MSSADAARPLVVAVDIGGTFTDVSLQDVAAGRAWTAKVPSTPADPSQAFIAGVRAALDTAGEEAGRIGRALHGTTVATNLILEGKTARTVLLTTEGFRHVLEIGRQDIPRAANLFAWVKPKRPVPPARVLEVPERIAVDGTVMRPLDEAAVARAAERCRELGAEAVAICLLHAYANPVHERRVLELLRAALPGVAITASTDVLPVVREYERSLATVLNAGVMPAVATYVGRLEARLGETGIAAPLLLMQSNGGVAGAERVRRAPAVTALSGPAAGVVGARAAAEAAGFRDVITIDIGGTSADICLIKGGEVGLTQRGHVGEWPLPLPMLDMVTIGAGGGSLARVSAEGALTVGPESAGAVPGPACYGRGGERPTVRDAHVALGHLPPSLLGGRMALDAWRAREAVRRYVAEPLGLPLEEAARGILRIADNTMVGAIRVVSVERGHDPRGFALVAFGGAGPLHGTALAELLGIRTVLVPPSPGVLCAQGLMAADLRAEFTASPRRGEAERDEVLNAAFDSLADDGRRWFEEERVPEEARATRRVALIRYAGQGSELAVAWNGSTAAAGTDFAREHRALYGFDLPEGVPEIVALRLEATGRLAVSPPPGLAARADPSKPTGTHRVAFAEGGADAALHDRSGLGAGQRVEGPAIIQQLDTTTLVPPGWCAVAHDSGTLLLERR